MKETLRKEDNIPFTQIANAVLNDKNISLKAKGLFSYIYSKPNGWDFAASRIANDNSDGVRSVEEGLKELVNMRYLVRTRRYGGGVEYKISWKKEQTQTAKIADSQNDKQLKRLTAKKAEISNKDYISNKEEESNKEVASNDAKPASAWGVKLKKKRTYSELGKVIIADFESVDPKNKDYYEVTTQRSASDFLIREYGIEAVRKVIKILPTTNNLTYFPTITTPHQLKENWTKLAAAIQKQKGEKKSRGRGLEE
jgi:hypothetical protein